MACRSWRQVTSSGRRIFKPCPKRDRGPSRLRSGRRRRADVAVQRERIRDAGDWLEPRAYAAHDHRAEVERSPHKALPDENALNLVEIHLDGVARDEAGLVDHPT